MVYLFAVLHGIQIAVDQLMDVVFFKHCAGDELRILQIHLILFIVAVVGKLRIARHCQFPRNTGVVPYCQRPYLMGLAQRHIVERLRGNACILCPHFRVRCPMSALAVVLSQIFAHRLPRSRPVVFGHVVPEIDVSPRLVELVEHIAQNPPVCTALGKAVAACVV